MLRAVLWMLIGALLAGGGYFFYQRKQLAMGEKETPQYVEIGGVTVELYELESKVTACRKAVADKKAELEKLSAELRSLPVKEYLAEKRAVLESQLKNCRGILEKLKKELSDCEKAVRAKTGK